MPICPDALAGGRLLDREDAQRGRALLSSPAGYSPTEIRGCAPDRVQSVNFGPASAGRELRRAKAVPAALRRGSLPMPRVFRQQYTRPIPADAVRTTAKIRRRGKEVEVEAVRFKGDD